MSAWKYPQVDVATPKPSGWVPDERHTSLLAHGHPLIQLNDQYVAQSSTFEAYHKIAVMLNQSEPSVYFDWGEGWLSQAPPYFVYYLGDYAKAKATYLTCLDRINEILKAEVAVVNRTRSMSAERILWFPLVPDDIIKENSYTFGQSMQ